MPAYIPDNLAGQYSSGSIASPLGMSHALTPAIYPHPVPEYSVVGFPSHGEYTYFYPFWVTMRDTYTGESAVKAKTVIYLPRHEKQTDKEYVAYLRRTPFYNAIFRTHQGLMGSVFRKAPDIIHEPNIKIDLNSVTRDHKSFHVMLREMVAEQLLTGRYGVLVDLPSETEGRPFAATYRAESILNWRTRFINGREELDQVLLQERETVNVGIGTVSVLMFRLLELVPDEVGNLYYHQKITRIMDASEASRGGTSGKMEEIIIPVIRGRRLNYIPFTFAGGITNTPDCEYPPLFNIATMNLSHYQSYAALEHGRFYAAMPTYYIQGDGFHDPNDPQSTVNPFIVGPNNMWLLGKEDKPGILEFTGGGLSYLENALESKQSQMASLGGKLITQSRKQAAISSNAWDLLAAGDEATLLGVTQCADEAGTKILQQLIQFTGTVITKEMEAKNYVELNKQFETSELTAREIRAIESIYKSRQIPKQVLYSALRDVSVIPPTMTEEEFFMLLNDEANLAEKPPEPIKSSLGTSKLTK
jgi:hypothetical protein